MGISNKIDDATIAIEHRNDDLRNKSDDLTEKIFKKLSFHFVR